jgi:DJ-1 family protein
MEAVICIDVFRRAGWEVTAAAVADNPLVCSRGVQLVADQAWADVEVGSYDILVLPGGGTGAEMLRAHAGVLDAVRSFHAAGKTVAAVCAAPLVLAEAGILEGRSFTCHPGVASQLTTGRRLAAAVVTDGNLITSQGPGTCFSFALEVVASVEGEGAARVLATAMVLDRHPDGPASKKDEYS